MTSQPSVPYQPPFVCPHCASPLQPDAKTWLCDGSLNAKGTRHPFDVARQGYVNLLPVQNKKSKDPGDSQQSIDARHRFLSQGFYQPLQQLISRLVEARSKQSAASAHSQLNAQTWLDVGCGEGYYTSAIAEALSATQTNHPCLIALDISKPAVATTARVAKQNKQLWYQLKVDESDTKATAFYPMVASASHLPLVDDSLDVISSIFSPILPKEFARVLKSEGQLLIAKPDSGHLQSMREVLFDEVRPHDSDKFLEELAPYFTLVDSHQITADLILNKQALADLLTMTPYSYRAKAEKREALLASTQREPFRTTARFVIYELQRL